MISGNRRCLQLSLFSMRCYIRLSQGEAAVIGADGDVVVRGESAAAELCQGAFHEDLVLESAAGKGYLMCAVLASCGDTLFNYHVCYPVVERKRQIALT